MMNVHAYFIGKTTYTMLNVRLYVRTNDECTHLCYCSHYLNVVSHITMSDLMMDVHTYVTDNTTYTMLCQINISNLMRNVHTCFTDNTTYTVVLLVKHACTFIIKSDLLI
jgi:hypothetical protein